MLDYYYQRLTILQSNNKILAETGTFVGTQFIIPGLEFGFLAQQTWNEDFPTVLLLQLPMVRNNRSLSLTIWDICRKI